MRARPLLPVLVAARGSWRAGARAATGAGATAALLAATGLVLRRRRRGMA